MKTSCRVFVAAVIAATLLQATASASIVVTPGTLLAQGNEGPGNGDVIAAAAAFLGITPAQLEATLQYTKNSDGLEVGPLASSYTTSFTPAGDFSAFTTSYGGGPVVDPTYLLVKDGNNVPIWYLFDINAWNGTSNLTGSGFWEGVNGAISHLSIYGSTTHAPEPATVFVWASLSGLTLAAVQLRRRRAELIV